MIVTLNCVVKYENDFANVYHNDNLLASENPEHGVLRVPPLFRRINKLSEDKCEGLIVYFEKEGEIVTPIILDKCYISVETYLLKDSFVHYKSQADDYPL